MKEWETAFTVAIPTGRAHLPRDRIGGARHLAATTLGATSFIEEALRWLPTSDVHGTPEESVMVEPPGAAVATQQSSLARGRILVADDNADMRDYIQRLLAGHHDVVSAEVGQAALDQIQTTIFMNVHAADLSDDDIYRGATQLGTWADRVVLEVTERSSLERVPALADRIRALRALGFRIAVDDLGAGYAGLASFSQLQPDIAKLDSSLIRAVDSSATKRRIVQAMIDVCRNELGVAVIGEGVETVAERDTLEGLGMDTVQGFLFGKPVSGFAEPIWVA